MSRHGLPVDALRDLDGGDGGQPVVRVLDEELQSELSQTSVELVSTELVSPPAVLQPLLRDGGQALPEGVHGIDGASVVIHPALVWPTCPVLSQPAQV